MQDKYSQRGVSSTKEDVHAAIKNLDKGVFPGAFCKIINNIFSTDNNSVLLLHSDTAGTKPGIAYLYWKETGDASVFRGIAQDAIVMNTDDLLCTGVFTNFILSSTIGRNKFLIPGEIIKEIIHGTEDFIHTMAGYGIKMITAGGETADVGDIIKTLDVGFTVFSITNKSNIINTSDIKPGLVIVGLSSSGKAIYEKEYNSGIGSNGLTSAKHDLLCGHYKDNYKEAYDSNINKKYVFRGKYKLTDNLPSTDIHIGKAILSPTRSFLPVVKKIFEECRENISAIIHCTGGGQTKCLKFGNNIHYIKDNVFKVPPLFKILMNNTKISEMFSVFNMGHRMEIYTDKNTADKIINISNEFNIQAKVVGYTESSPDNKNRLTIKFNNNNLEYEST